MEKIHKIVVVAFISNGGKLLICKRNSKEEFLPGVYELPGGKLDFGESPENGLKRGLKEELNADIEASGPFHCFSYITKKGSWHNIEIAFFARIKNLEKMKLNVHEDVKWVTEEELNSYKITPEEKKSMLKGFEIKRERGI